MSRGRNPPAYILFIVYFPMVWIGFGPTKASYIPFGSHTSRDADGCDPRVYRVLDDHRRSVNYEVSNFENPLCDDLLPYGWYRFLSYGLPREMATECPAGNACGTQAQVWINVGTNVLNTGNITVDACVSWGFHEQDVAVNAKDNLADCCLFTLPVSIQNCNGFNVYYLGPTQACSIAYCSASVPTKTHNALSASLDVSGFSLQPIKTPKIVFYVKHGDFYFHCKTPCRECRITWQKTQKRGADVISVGSGQRVESFTNLGLKSGDELTCIISSGATGSSARSKPFQTGLSLDQTKLDLTNNGDVYELVVEQHLPLLCGTASNLTQCHLVINVQEKSKGNMSVIKFKRCTITIKDANVCSIIGERNHCNRVSIQFQVSDSLDISSKNHLQGSLHIQAHSALTGSKVETFNVPYKIHMAPRQACHLFTLGHMVTLDQKLIALKEPGIYILLRSGTNDFELSAELERLDSETIGIKKVSIRQFQELIRIELRFGTLSVSGMKYSSKHLIVKQVRHKHSLWVLSSSQRIIRINWDHGLLSISLMGLAGDLSSSDGLCQIEYSSDSLEFRVPNFSSLSRLNTPEQNQVVSCADQLNKPQNLSDLTFMRLEQPSEKILVPEEDFYNAFVPDNEEDIRDLCTNEIVNSSLAKSCGPFFTQDIMIPIKICILDMNVTKSQRFIKATLPLIENQCELSLALSPLPLIPQDLRDTFACSHPCLQKDFCLPANCDVKPEINHQYCDLRHKMCPIPESVEPSGTHCTLRYGSTTNKLVPFEMPVIVRQNRSYCRITNSVEEQFRELIKPEQVQIELHNRTNISSIVSWNLMMYDSACLDCSPSKGCQLNRNICIIQEKCFPTGTNHPEDRCLICSDNGEWIIRNEPEVKKQEFHILNGDRWFYRVREEVRKIVAAPESLSLVDGNILEWTAPISGPNTSQVIILEMKPHCGEVSLHEFIIRTVRCDCQHGGKCASTSTDFECLCPKGWKGLNCEMSTSSCNELCQNGRCVEDGICDCHPGFIGELCDKKLGTCWSNPCFQGVECHEIPNGFLCDSCPPGFTGNGIKCAEVDPCSPNPCFPGVDCFKNHSGGFSCGSCPYRMSGNGRICQPFSPCDSNPCYPGVACFPLGDNFVCANCPPQLTGDGINCTKMFDDANLCNFEATNPCFEKSMCYQSDGQAHCKACPDGYKGDGMECQAVSFNKCEVENPCHPASTCLYVNGILTCGPCPDNMTGNGKVCHWIDPCYSQPCFEGVNCTPDARLNQGYLCGPCPTGMTGNGTQCETIQDYCNPNPCFANLTCSVKTTGFECGPCPMGMIGNGLVCQHQNHSDPCSPSPCYPNVKCISDGQNNFTCGMCPPGFVGNGINCTPVDPCHPNPCYPGVKCRSTENSKRSYVCGPCPWGLYGDGEECHGPPNHCQSNPCYPGVQCFNYPEKFKCGNCPASLTGNGIKCTSVLDPCQPSPCFEGVDCVTVWEGRHAVFSCGLCPDGMIGNGIFCYVTDPCSPNPCHHGSQCIPKFDQQSYECGSCPPGLIADGKLCRKPFHPCESNPCYPGVNCGEKNGTFTCGTCPDGMSGDGISCHGFSVIPCPEGTNCFSGVDECLLTDEGKVVCGSCPVGFIGDGLACEPLCDPKCNIGYECIAPNVCSALCNPPCANGGECMDDGTCFCPTGYFGDWCQFREASSSQKRKKLLQCADKQCFTRFMEEDCNMIGCQNGGTCSSDSGTCSCKNGFYGSLCQHSSKAFEGPMAVIKRQNPYCKRKCQNGGVCVENNRCSCPTGFRGRFCQKPKCTGGCRNGGKCIKPEVCECAQGFTGKNCKQGVCKPKCRNGGFCKKSGKCRCQRGFRGKYCQLTRLKHG